MGESPIAVTADLQGRVDGRLLGVALADELYLLTELGELEPLAGIALAGALYIRRNAAPVRSAGDYRVTGR